MKKKSFIMQSFKTTFSLLLSTFVFFQFLFSLESQAQNTTLKQSIRGKVIDQVTELPIIGATVVIIDSSPIIGTVTNIDGEFKLPNISIGRIALKISIMGYEERVISNLLVDAGKEIVLNIKLSERINTIKEVEITASGSQNKSEALNEMASVSSRQFSVEETKRYAGSLNDPGRMAQSFAGVASSNDQSNEIVVRGNSPRGMLWRLEGVEIAAPSHFANQGAAGGAISMLSVNMMANSDFYTGAFPADYGNAASGVFDINLRKGNNEKREYAFQVGVLGTDVALEGPFKKGYKGSYLINYRYSSLALLQKAGIDIVGDAVPQFQDISFNINLPTNKLGTFSLFGLGGLSEIDQSYFGKNNIFKSRFTTNLGIAGISHKLILSKSSWLKTIATYNLNGSKYKDQMFDTTEVYKRTNYTEEYENIAFRFASTFHHKISAKNSFKAGIILSKLNFNLLAESFNETTTKLEPELKSKGGSALIQSFISWQYRPNNLLTLNGGVHYSQFLLNNGVAVEPRLGARYKLSANKTLTAGLGVHSRLEDMGIYFANTNKPGAPLEQANKSLGFSKARHAVLGYEQLLSEHLFMKAEVYYQQLYNVPVSRDTLDGLTMINLTQGFTTVAAINNGTGENYGVELTLEKYFSKRYFFLFTSSLYQSTAKGSDGISRNTLFNGNYNSQLSIGKEFVMGRNRLNTSIRGILAGGRRYTAVLLDESIASERTVYDDNNLNAKQMEPYVRFDFQINYTINKKKTTRVWKIDIQNVLNRANPAGLFFNADLKKVETYTQLGILPTLSYRIEF